MYLVFFYYKLGFNVFFVCFFKIEECFFRIDFRNVMIGLVVGIFVIFVILGLCLEGDYLIIDFRWSVGFVISIRVE